MPVPVPSGVEVSVSGQDVTVKGPKGSLDRTFPERVSIMVEDGEA
jgi:large subunit ribosomal protein L6